MTLKRHWGKTRYHRYQELEKSSFMKKELRSRLRFATTYFGNIHTLGNKKDKWETSATKKKTHWVIKLVGNKHWNIHCKITHKRLPKLVDTNRNWKHYLKKK